MPVKKVLTFWEQSRLGLLELFGAMYGVEHDQFAAASKAEDDVNFYQTDNPDVTKMFHIDTESKRFTLVLRKNAPEIFESGTKKQWDSSAQRDGLGGFNNMKVYAPWCGHCQALEPMYDKLAKHIRSIDSLVIVKQRSREEE
ncbi:hypothetical protein Bca52824_004665 [Brassica carinata]|uniref:Thioredoxin domain-containing protein n=1 Tax=Brassica carinata TaxID=52824 RepID=A0A8X7WQJ9_BRACI|nr:hypothetical protein Bca52824_004665 [Brassica carinata]